ncbi:response regulator transcription factor [Bacillus solitudinis]|uniref:response regulator transcription factor n=1 Tax=Bacillus solitudinis TaxID=2014074 RepID=UPI0018E235A7|nr:response regulator [Bacillus solitudinis]
MKILVVDDEPFILNGLMTIINKNCPQMTELEGACDGIEALHKSKQNPPDLVITDINMPEMSGLDLIKNIRNLQTCNRFIILSGYNDFHYARQAIQYQVIDYLLKPINKSEIIHLIQKSFEEIYEKENKEKYKSEDPIENIDQYSKHIKQVLSYISENYQQDLSLDELAGYINLHRNYLSSLFKKETGLTFIHYLHAFRITKAKDLLMNSPELSIHQVGKLVGYENQEHFYKVFRKLEGQPPGKFRDCI